MLGPVARFSVRAGRARALGAAVAVCGLLGIGAVTASAQLLPLSTPTPTCLVDLSGNCVLGTGSTSSTPTPTASSSLCVLIICSTPTPLPGSTDTQATPTPACALNTCLPQVNPTCDVTSNLNCLTATPTPCQTNCGGGGGGGSTNTPGGNTPGRTSGTRPSSSSSGFGGGLGLGGGDTGGGSVTGAGPNVPVGLSVARVPDVQSLGPGSGLQFGHAPILWPLFGLLDVLGLVAVLLVMRRSRSAEPD